MALILLYSEKTTKLHAELNERDGCTKRSYILFLVKPAVLALTDIKQSFTHQSAGVAIANLLDIEQRNINFGSTSWALFGQALRRELEMRRSSQSEAAEMLVTLIGDFLADLNSRHLLEEEIL